MEQIIKTYLGLFFMMMLLCTGFGLISSSIISRAANNLALEYEAEIRNSNFSPAVIDQCISSVRTNNEDAYDDLEVTSQKDQDGRKSGNLVLTYHYRIPFVGLDSTKSIKRVIL